MKDLFWLREIEFGQLNKLWKQVIFGYKSLRVQGPKSCKNLPYHIKSSEIRNI